jgi:hypothetical protein
MIIAALAAATVASGVNTHAKYVEPIGVGAETCATWVRSHDAHNRTAAEQDEWLAGYLTALNTFGRPPLRRMSFFRFDLPNVIDAVTSSCRREPGQLIFEAVTGFVERVQDRTK